MQNIVQYHVGSVKIKSLAGRHEVESAGERRVSTSFDEGVARGAVSIKIDVSMPCGATLNDTSIFLLTRRAQLAG